MIGFVAGAFLEDKIEAVARMAPIQYRTKEGDGDKKKGAEGPDTRSASTAEKRRPKMAVPPPRPIRTLPEEPCLRHSNMAPTRSKNPPNPTT
jgi:hypothetical protein